MFIGIWALALASTAAVIGWALLCAWLVPSWEAAIPSFAVPFAVAMAVLWFGLVRRR